MASTPGIVLNPWGRVEGTLRIGNRVGAGETIWLGNWYWRYGPFPSLQLHMEATTDANGHFVFEGVPPGEREICHQLNLKAGKTGPKKSDEIVLKTPRSTAMMLRPWYGQSQRTLVRVEPGQTTQVTLGGSLDLFRTESILLKTHWILVIMDQFTRRIVGFGVQPVAVEGVALCRMFNKAINGQGLPKRLSTDHDPLFQFNRWQANLRILDVETVQTVPQVPWSHPFVERLVGTVWREYLDRTFFWNACDLERKLEQFKSYFNQDRVHQSLDGTTPEEKGGRPSPLPVNLKHYSWQSHCNGLFELPIAA